MTYEVPVPDHQIGRLDVAVGEAVVPHTTHQCQALVDDRIVDLGLADLDGAIEELGDQQVLAFGGELDDADRAGRRHTGVADHPKGVVLVLHEAADRLERLLVLETAVQDGAPELVPPVGAHVVHRVELAEQVRVGVAGDAEAQRRRAARPGEPDRLDLDRR